MTETRQSEVEDRGVVHGTAKITLVPTDPSIKTVINQSSSRSQTHPGWISRIPLITPFGVDYVSQQTKRLRRGRSAVLRSPLGGDVPLAEHFRIIDGFVRDKVTSELLLDFEASNASKVSPMSVQYPFAQRKSQVQQYFTDPGGDVTDEELRLACHLALLFTGCNSLLGRIRPLSLANAMEELPKDTQWGLPYCVKGVELDDEASNPDELVYKDYRPAYLTLAQEMATDLSHVGWTLPCLMGWRGDLGKPTKDDPIGTKQRVVWMYPHAISIIEEAYFKPLTAAIAGRPGFAAWQTESKTMQAVVSLLRQPQPGDGTATWAFDATAFDQHLNGRLIDAVSKWIVQPMFQPGNQDILERLSRYSKTCGIVTPDGILTGRDFNRPSGSGGTNFLDCWENLVMFIVVALRAGATEREVLAWLKQVMGDDALYNGRADLLEKLAPLYERAFGAKVSVEKSNLGVGQTTYLRRVYDDPAGIIGAASAHRVFAKSYYYEHPTPKGWSEWLDEIRWIAQLETLRFNPCYEDVVLYYVSLAPHGLGTKLEGGPRQLWAEAQAKLDGRSVDSLLRREDFLMAYRGYSADKPETMVTFSLLQSLWSGK